MLKTTRVAILVGLAVSLSGVAAYRLASAAGARSFEGKKPPALELSGVLNAEEVPELDAHRGKVVLLEFWATWCPPCRRSVPHLNKLHSRFDSEGLEIIGITDERPETVKPFAKKFEMAYTIGLDNEGKTTAAYEVQGIPSAYILDRKGIVRWEGHPLEITNDLIERFLESD
jgi:thiol-disulfide isomerase/thioredoxin